MFIDELRKMEEGENKELSLCCPGITYNFEVKQIGKSKN